MYAHAPHASATTPPSSIPQQHQPQVLDHGQPQAMPPAVHGGHHGMQPTPGATFQNAASSPTMTGAYQPSGDPSIDRMLRLEMACKRYGSLI